MTGGGPPNGSRTPNVLATNQKVGFGGTLRMSLVENRPQHQSPKVHDYVENELQAQLRQDREGRGQKRGEESLAVHASNTLTPKTLGMVLFSNGASA